ncbi:MAG: SDR family NAD(P)-dependent oxidoreductase [Acidimicrobiales bacterium]|nr:SDR family NAD(P)-dependent oxidoreductase [Acidimicrobiales bacterium]
MENLNGKIGVVTGAASGIGQSMAERFCKEGMSVVLADIEEESLHAAVDDIVADGGNAVGVVTDVSSKEAIKNLAEETIKHFGAVHVLHNNAGVVAAGLLDDLTTKDWEWTIGVNLWSVIHGIQTFLPLIKESGEGHIINTSSSEGLQASAGTGAYNVTKFGIVAITETLSNELASFPDINASVLCPGPVQSRIIESERNRPERLWNDGVPAAGLVDNDQSSDLLAGAMDPALVAELVIQSIQTNQFWVITHEETKEVVRQRTKALLENGSLSAPLYDFSE